VRRWDGEGCVKAKLDHSSILVIFAYDTHVYWSRDGRKVSVRGLSNVGFFDCSSHAYIPMRAGSETQLLLSVTYHYSNIVPPLLAHTTSAYDSA